MKVTAGTPRSVVLLDEVERLRPGAVRLSYDSGVQHGLESCFCLGEFVWRESPSLVEDPVGGPVVGIGSMTPCLTALSVKVGQINLQVSEATSPEFFGLVLAIPFWLATKDSDSKIFWRLEFFLTGTFFRKETLFHRGPFFGKEDFLGGFVFF